MRLGGVWDKRSFCGWYWRLYHDDAPGAGIIIDGKSIELTPDNFYLVPPGVRFRTWQTSDPRQFYLHFESPWPYGQMRSGCYSFAMTRTVTGLVKSVKRELREGGGRFHYTPKGGVLCVSLAALALSFIPAEELVHDQMALSVESVIQHIRENLRSEIAVRKLAKTAGVCPDVFIRLFKKRMGVTPYNYLTTIRINKSLELLENSSLTIAEICELCGFKDCSHFSKLFKAKTGLPPAKHRKLYKLCE